MSELAILPSRAGDEVAFARVTDKQRAHLDALTSTVSREQALWISGYLAGIAAEAAPQGRPTVFTEPAVSPARVTVLYGSETGNAQGLAERLGTQLDEAGLEARVVSMEDYRVRDLKDEKRLIVVTATHGDGDPPEPGRAFYEFVMGRKAPRLDDLQFAVLGLGDTSYEYFCKAAKALDHRLDELGGQRLRARIDCDIDYDEAAAAWIDGALKDLEAVDRRAGTVVSGTTPAPVATATTSADAPVEARILDRVVLNGRGSSKTTYHLELSLERAQLAYEPGDALGVVAENDPRLVEECLATLGLTGDEDLARDLARNYELTVLTPRFLKAFGEVAAVPRLRELLEDTPALRTYLENRQIVDVIRDHPVRGISGEDFKKMLRELKPRLYSIASSPRANPEEVHITVAEIGYQSPFGRRVGVASGFLGQRSALEDSVSVYVERNDRFRLPADPDVPVIMVGAGTGIAPYRGFLQDRAEQGVRGRSWLFFGAQHFRTDFLYQTEWQRFKRDGVLTEMEVAFSRDQPEKIYVQDRLRVRGKEIFAWLEAGAHFYVCGDAKKMAPDVHRALVDVVSEHGALNAEYAEDYVRQLIETKRYKRDVY